MLDEILEATESRARSAAARADGLRDAMSRAPAVRDFSQTLVAPGLSVIAEVKRRSPSAGDLAVTLDPSDQARRYAAGGAAAISVLTEPHYFGGSLEDLATVRLATDLPVLRKDFMLNEAQIWESRTAGADAVLLIAAVLGGRRLPVMLEAVAAASMTALVEVHDEAEAERAVAAGASVVGVNNRDLGSFVTDLAVAERLSGRLANVAVRVAESGVRTAVDAARMAAAGYDAVLVGEALVRSEDPTRLIRAFRGHP